MLYPLSYSGSKNCCVYCIRVGVTRLGRTRLRIAEPLSAVISPDPSFHSANIL